MGKLNIFSNDAKFHHIGIAVKSIKEVDSSIEMFDDPIQKVKIGFVQLNGINIELLEPHGEDSPISASMKKGIKLLHICYEVPDIEKAIQECREYGFHLVGYHNIAQPIEAVAFKSKIVWVYSREYGLFELLEEKK